MAWEQVRIGAEALRRWTVRVTSPYVSEVFDNVSKATLRPGVWRERPHPTRRGHFLGGPDWAIAAGWLHRHVVQSEPERRSAITV